MSSAARRRQRKNYNNSVTKTVFTDRKWEPPNTWKTPAPINRPEHKGACGSIVFRDYSCEEVLLVSKNKDYGFPKGSSKKGETNEETAARELEETGLKRTDVVRVGDKYIDHCKSNGTVRYFIGMARNVQLCLQPDCDWEFLDGAFLKLEESGCDGVLQKADLYMNSENSDL